MTDAELELHPDAIQDVLDGYAWYLQKSARVAHSFFSEVERAVQLVQERPQTWPRYILGTRRFMLAKFPYSVVYKTTEDRTIVYAVAHAKRRPRYWRDRLTREHTAN